MVGTPRERPRWALVVAGVVLFLAGFTLLQYSIFTLAEYHFVGFAMSLIGSRIAAVGFFGRSFLHRTRGE